MSDQKQCGWTECRDEVALRVRLWNYDSYVDMFVCSEHASEAGGQYPDNIETLESYEKSR